MLPVLVSVTGLDGVVVPVALVPRSRLLGLIETALAGGGGGA